MHDMNFKTRILRNSILSFEIKDLELSFKVPDSQIQKLLKYKSVIYVKK